MSEKNILVRFFSSIWRGVDGVRKVLHLLLLLVLFLGFFGAMSSNTPMLPASAALKLSLVGPLVDQLDGDPYDRALARLVDDIPPQTLVQDVVDALLLAKNDDGISAVHLELSGLAGGGLSKLRRIGAALEDFKGSGKPVIASADFYNQAGYYVAAHADELYMHPEGMVFMQGYGGYRNYFKDAIDHLQIDWNVFRVGTHKSFVEPYTRMDMSPEDRESRQELIDQFWAMYLGDVEAARDLAPGTIDDFVQNLVEHAARQNGDLALAAQAAGLTDELLARAELRAVMQSYAGVSATDESSYPAVGYADYLRQNRLLSSPDVDSENVAIVVAVGNILNGSQPPGTIGGDSTAALLRKALDDETVRAVVLRVDSPGGSVFASEVIADEIIALQSAGKPVVASMSSVAASGGYWISVVADKVLASPATITGSIGVFGMFPTYQRSLKALGVQTDGVGTSPWTGQLRGDREMSEPTKALFQTVVSDTYDDFITRVASLREMEKSAVDGVAQGQVWSGTDALAHGLIDELGTFEDAISSAAQLAGLAEGEYGRKFIDVQLTPTEQIILDALSLARSVGLDASAFVRSPGTLDRVASAIEDMLKGIAAFNDPKAVYSHCFCSLD